MNCILDVAGYCNGNISRRHVIDNSCGDGAFLVEIVRRYCVDYLGHCSDKHVLAKQLSKYIHGIELDSEHHATCIARLNHIVREYGVDGVEWDIINDNTLNVHRFDNRMDFVVGNPPYVRVHNLDTNYENVKKYGFASGGMTDLYLVFFQIGFKMMSPNGKLCYITPSSWINSVAGDNFRHYIAANKNLMRLIDLQHFQAFEAATTYTMISLFNAEGNCAKFSYEIFDEVRKTPEPIDYLSIDDILFGNSFILGSQQQLAIFGEIVNHLGNKYAVVKNGFATLADNIFIADSFPFKSNIIPIIKASTGKWRKAIYPYDKSGTPLPFDELSQDVGQYLMQNRGALLKGKDAQSAPTWYLYGRTQALRDVSKEKWSINQVIRGIESVKLNKVPSGSGLYSGLYIMTNASEIILREALICDDFINYITMLKKYKSGGYYTFNSRDLECFLNYKIDLLNKNKHEQSRIFGSNPSLF